MPSFLSKVFGRKKADDKDRRSSKRASNGSLLEGKFEAVSATPSPSATHFIEAAQAREQERRERENQKARQKDNGFTLFHTRSRPTSPPPPTQKKPSDVPHLSLNLPKPKEERSRALGVVFEADPEALTLLDDVVIGERRLTPLETLVLVRACSQVIVERGLETLGIMHPHWYSASPEVQRKLISLYILSLAPKSPITTLSPTSAASVSAFESELSYARSPYDVAAVLRWGLRHLKLEADAFGKDASDWAWYDAFAQAEQSASYPLRAFSQSLVPQLPPAHSELLFATLDVISSLAAHSESNGISGSKLSKFLGIWLLTGRRASEADDWKAFYDRWERAGRILEHLFLSRIRDEAAQHKMPKRLTGLTDHYPYSQGSSLSDDGLLCRPRFSTRHYDALYVRLETEYTGPAKPKSYPLRIIAEAFKSKGPEDGELVSVWDTIKKASRETSEGGDVEAMDSFPVFSHVFSDETIRLLSLIPADGPDKGPTSQSLHPLLPTTSQNGHGNASSSGHGGPPSSTPAATGTGTAPTTASPETPADWLQFTSIGFIETPGPRDLASTLWDTDVEKTTPPDALSRKSSKKRRSFDRSRRSSVDNPSPLTPSSVPPSPPPPATKTVVLARIKLDEAFVDFWSDALLDPISSDWPRFVSQTDLAFSNTARRAATASPRPSITKTESAPTRVSLTLNATKKRFSFFSGSESKVTAKKKASKSPKVGEMGDIVREEEEKDKEEMPSAIGNGERPSSVQKAEKADLGISGAEAAAGAAAVATVAVGAAVAVKVAEDGKAEEPFTPIAAPTVQESTVPVPPTSETTKPASSSEPIIQEATTAASVAVTPAPEDKAEPAVSTSAEQARVAEETVAVKEVTAAAEEAYVVPPQEPGVHAVAPEPEPETVNSVNVKEPKVAALPAEPAAIASEPEAVETAVKEEVVAPPVEVPIVPGQATLPSASKAEPEVQLVSEEPRLVIVDAPVADISTSVAAAEPLVRPEISAPAVAPTPAPEASAPATEHTAPETEGPAAAVLETPILAKTVPASEEIAVPDASAPVVENLPPILEDISATGVTASALEAVPTAEQSAPIVEDAPALEGPAPVAEAAVPAVPVPANEEASTAEEALPVEDAPVPASPVEESSVPEETTVQEFAVVPEESSVVEESSAPIAEKSTAIEPEAQTASEMQENADVAQNGHADRVVADEPAASSAGKTLENTESLVEEPDQADDAHATQETTHAEEPSASSGPVTVPGPTTAEIEASHMSEEPKTEESRTSESVAEAVPEAKSIPAEPESVTPNSVAQDEKPIIEAEA